MMSTEPFPVLETPRVRLREITAADAPAYLKIFGNADHMRLFGVEPLPDLAAAEALIEAFAGSHRLENPHIRWAVEAKTSLGLIGNCGFLLGIGSGENAVLDSLWRKDLRVMDT